MSPDIVRIFGRTGALPEVEIDRVDAREDHPLARLQQLRRQMGATWRVWAEKFPRINPAVRQVNKRLRPKRSRAELYAQTDEAAKQPFNPRGPAVYGREAVAA